MTPIILMLIMACASILGAFGQVFMHKGSTGAELSFSGIVLNPWLWGFCIMYGIGVIINFAVYRMGGKVAYIMPVTSLSYVFAAILAWWLLGDTPNGIIWTGIGIIMVGVVVLGYGASLA